MDNENFELEAKLARREYFKAWRAANKEKVREYNRRYWEKLAAKRMQKRSHEYGQGETDER